MSRLIDADELLKHKYHDSNRYENAVACYYICNAPIIDAVEVVRCKECKHRPIKEDADGENYGFNLIKPNDGDELCPCLVSDGWYSWMPEDNFFCGYGERKDE